MRNDLNEILSRQFGVSVHGHDVDTESQYLKRLQEALAVRIEHLINTDIDKLLQILYRIDVPQFETDKSFELGEIKKISMQLAESIIRRQLKKIDYAKKFYGDK